MGFQAVEGDGLQAVRYHRKTIAALASEDAFFPGENPSEAKAH
jgi:hypothetical protein